MCVHLNFSFRLTVFLSPLSEVQCQNFLDIKNPWGKVMGKKGLRYEHLGPKWCKIAAEKKVITDFFLSICSIHLNIFLPPLVKVQCPNFLDFWNPCKKVMSRSGLRF